MLVPELEALPLVTGLEAQVPCLCLESLILPSCLDRGVIGDREWVGANECLRNPWPRA